MQTTANIDNWIQAASANLNISTADRLKASNLFHEFQRLDWWSDYSDDGDVRYREMIRTGNALDQLKEFAGASKDHAYLASRIYDKTAPEEFERPAPWYIPADPETMRAIDAKAEDTPSQLRVAWQAPAFSRETIDADPETAVYLPIPEKATPELLAEARRCAMDHLRWAEAILSPSQATEAATARVAELDARLQIEHSRWTGEPLGEAVGVSQSAGKGQSHR